jgi:hypothetical protein
MKRMVSCALLLALCSILLPLSGNAGYPPTISPPSHLIKPQSVPAPGSPTSLIFANSHNYGSVIIDVRVYNNYLGDPTYYWWTYIVRNISYDPDPLNGTNGFSGFELALPVNVPDIANILPGPPPWSVNCCSGLPVEWDQPNSQGPGVLPGNTQQYSFSTLPRLITSSSGWFHTWINNGQAYITNYPSTDAPEVPDVVEPVVPVKPMTWGAVKSLYNS